MDVDRALWWSVSRGWILLWVATLIALVVVVVLAWRWMRHRDQGPEVPGLLFYVHGQRMINLCEIGRYDDAVTRQFVKQITVTKNGKLQVGPSEFGIGVDGSVVEQNTGTYEKPATIRADEAWRRGRARRLNDIRDTLPPGQFNARCLGKVQSWNAATGEIVVLPVVVFQ